MIKKKEMQDRISKCAKEYIKGYEVQKQYFEERIHTSSKFDGVSIVCDYNVVELMRESLREHMNKIEAEIARCYKTFEETCEMQTFLVENKDEIERRSKLSLIENFSLKNLEVDGKVINILPSLDMNRLYNGKGVESLECLKKDVWSKIERLLAKRSEIYILADKLSDASHDDWVEDEDEIVDVFIKNYNKIDCDKLYKLQDKKELIKDKDEILSDVYTYVSRNARNLYKYVEKDARYICNNFSWDNFVDYCYVREVYEQIISDMAKDKE